MSSNPYYITKLGIITTSRTSMTSKEVHHCILRGTFEASRRCIEKASARSIEEMHRDSISKKHRRDATHRNMRRASTRCQRHQVSQLSSFDDVVATCHHIKRGCERTSHPNIRDIQMPSRIWLKVHRSQKGVQRKHL